MKQFNNVTMRFGFTLIEILIVVSIITIMAGVGLATFTGSNKKAHDAKQKADIETIRSSLELYKADNNGYPNNVALLSSYLPNYPTPPAGGSYIYTASGCTGALCSGYSVCAILESDGSGYCGIPGGAAITPPVVLPTATPAPTLPAPSSTPIPTSTPVPTSTPNPTPTSTPTPTPTTVFE